MNQVRARLRIRLRQATSRALSRSPSSRTGAQRHHYAAIVRSPAPYLLYLGPLRPKDDASAERIAHLIADHASVNLDGTYRVTPMSEAEELANCDGAAVAGPDGDAVLYVVEVPYRAALRLDEKGQPADRTSMVLNLLQSLKFVILAVYRLVTAGRKEGSKTRRAKQQLFIGLLYVGALALVVVLAALALIGAIWPDALPWIASKKSGPRIAFGVFGFSFTFGAAYFYVKRKTAPAGRIAQRLLSYVEHPEASKETARALEKVIDRIVERSDGGGAKPAFHVLGYSLGALVALDALCPPKGFARGQRLDLVRSFATVGCPADFVRLYYPDYYEDRAALSPTVPWHNLFIANDVLGSNFLDVDPRAEPEDRSTVDRLVAPVEGVAVPGSVLQPSKNFGVGSAGLTLLDLLKSEGFSLHAHYWSEQARSSIVDVLMPLWPPMRTETAEETPRGPREHP